MNKIHPLQNIVINQHKGIPQGIYSVCSANTYVIEAAMDEAKEKGTFALIEATCNQVNQFGGYTGMKPADFRDQVYKIAGQCEFPIEKLILGGDHLGPNPWKNEPAEQAMAKAIQMIRLYILAGFTKIHIDTSMHLGDDDHSVPLDTEVVAQRSALLCQKSEEAFSEYLKNNTWVVRPVYVIGTEVPIPGGSQDTLEELKVTDADDCRKAIETYRKAFKEYQLEAVWDHVIAIVVQPGVEFGDANIHAYDRPNAKELCSVLKEVPTLIFEGHSTDYQKASSLKEMVEDGIGILKVGPALTFAMREALFMLNHIENEMFNNDSSIQLSHFIDTLDKVMAEDPGEWAGHYHGNDNQIQFSCKYSFSDRSRYYMGNEMVVKSLNTMLRNLSSIEMPLSIISQYMPEQYVKIREGSLQNDPVSLIKDKIRNVLEYYDYAIRPTVH